MLAGLKRYYGNDDLHFITFSCYRAGGSAFIPGQPAACVLVSCKRWVTLLRFCPIYSPPTTPAHYSLPTTRYSLPTCFLC